MSWFTSIKQAIKEAEALLIVFSSPISPEDDTQKTCRVCQQPARDNVCVVCYNEARFAREENKYVGFCANCFGEVDVGFVYCLKCDRL